MCTIAAVRFQACLLTTTLRGKSALQGQNKTYYHVKDIAYLLHEPLLKKARELAAYDKKVGGSPSPRRSGALCAHAAPRLQRFPQLSVVCCAVLWAWCALSGSACRHRAHPATCLLPSLPPLTACHPGWRAGEARRRQEEPRPGGAAGSAQANVPAGPPRARAVSPSAPLRPLAPPSLPEGRCTHAPQSDCERPAIRAALPCPPPACAAPWHPYAGTPPLWTRCATWTTR